MNGLTLLFRCLHRIGQIYRDNLKLLLIDVLLEKKIRILETYVNNIPEDYVRNILEKRLFLCKGRYSRWDVNKVKAEYSYKDKCFLNVQIEK